MMVEGYCQHCQRIHGLDSALAQRAGHRLMAKLEATGCLDVDGEVPGGDSALATAWLFGPARGKMLGILLCKDLNGQLVELKAFSGQFNGRWLVQGWVGPIFCPQAFQELVAPVDRQIKALDHRIAHCGGVGQRLLRERRRHLSRQLMEAIHGLYRLHNFRGERALLHQVFQGGIPTGTGDCCAPKLLCQAARQGLKPVSLAEFYWGRENRSSTRRHGRFYPPCREKCLPLLGWLLCGCDERA
jgi:hypothetical protein